MRSNIIAAAALAQLAAAAPGVVKRQNFDFNAVLTAPSPTATGAPLSGAETGAVSMDTASMAMSISAAVTTEATAKITGSAASAASTKQPSATALNKRGLIDALLPWLKKTTTTTSSAQPTTTTSKDKKTSSSAAPATTSAKTTSSSTTTQQTTTGSSTTSAESSCPTTPEAGTYCGFINPLDTCAPQPGGYGPHVFPDTVTAFQLWPEFQLDAMLATTPKGYTQVFQNLNAAVSANSYLAYKQLESYSTADCAAYCDATDLCTSFNLYIERDPSVNPTTNGPDQGWGTNCPNPPSITNYKCAIFGSSISKADATNTGSYRDEFEVVIVASNGYDKTPTSIPDNTSGWNAPEKCAGGAITAGGDYWMGSKFFPGAFNPHLCALYADAQTNKNKQIALDKGATSYVPCNQFNAYMVHKNGHAQGTYCQLYDTVLDKSWASTKESWSGSDHFEFENSWTYSRSQLDSGSW